MSRNSSHSRSFDQTSASGWLSGIIKTVLAVLVVVIVAEWIAGLIMDQTAHDSREALATPKYNEEQVVLLYDTKEPESYTTALEETAAFRRFVHTPGQAYRLQPFQGYSVTIDEFGVRGHPSVPSAPQTVFLFGNSTAAGFGVKDAETVAAYLQGDLVTENRPAQVLNFGTPLYTSSSERMALERLLLEGQKPDLVIFLDGLEEFRQCLPTSGTTFSEALTRAVRNWSVIPEADINRWRNEAMRLWQQTNLYHLFRWWETRGEKQERQSTFCQSDAGVSAAIQRLEVNRKIITGMADQFGFKVLFVQQPVPLWHYNNGKRAVVAQGNALNLYAATAKGYQKLDSLRKNGGDPASVLWLAELEPEEGNAYIDDLHYSPRMNAAIAKAIAQRITRDNLLPQKTVYPAPTPLPAPATESPRTGAAAEPPTPTAVPTVDVERQSLSAVIPAPAAPTTVAPATAPRGSAPRPVSTAQPTQPSSAPAPAQNATPLVVN